MPTIYTSLQTDNHTNTSPLNSFIDRMLFLTSHQQRQSTQGQKRYLKIYLKFFDTEAAELTLRQQCPVCRYSVHKEMISLAGDCFYRGTAFSSCAPTRLPESFLPCRGRQSRRESARHCCCRVAAKPRDTARHSLASSPARGLSPLCTAETHARIHQYNVNISATLPLHSCCQAS